MSPRWCGLCWASWCHRHATTLDCFRHKQMSQPLDGLVTLKKPAPEGKKCQLDKHSRGCTNLFRNLSGK